MTQPYSPELHGQVGVIMGIPVFESARVDAPRLVRVPIPGTSESRLKLVVRDWEQFEREWWIETTLNKVITEQMGDTLQWLYGNRRWQSPNSPYSMLKLRMSVQLQMDAIKAAVNDAARTLQSAFAPVVGLFSAAANTPDSGSTVTQPADGRSTSFGRRFET